MSKIPERKEVERILRSYGLRVTGPRAAILTRLMEADQPTTAEEVSESVAPHLVTVYRTLNEFVAQGLVYQTDFRTGRAYFEYQKDHHHHITCLECGYREGVEVCLPDLAWQRVKSKARNFTSVSGHSLEFFGCCRKCQKAGPLN